MAAFLSRVVQLRGDDFAGGNKNFFAEGRFNAQITLEDITSPPPPPPATSSSSSSSGGVTIPVEGVTGAEGEVVTPSTPPPLSGGEEGEGGGK